MVHADEAFLQAHTWRGLSRFVGASGEEQKPGSAMGALVEPGLLNEGPVRMSHAMATAIAVAPKS